MGKLARLEELFVCRHFAREVIILCVRWYLRFKHSLRDLVEMMAERGLSLAHTTIMRWVQRYARVRETLAPVCPGGRPLMAGRRDLRQDPRRVVLPVPGVNRGGRRGAFRRGPRGGVGGARRVF